MDDVEQIRELVDRIIKTQENRDYQKIIEFHHPDAFILGTGKKEILDTFDKIKEVWRLSLDIEELRVLDPQILNIKVNGNVAWVILITNVEAVIEGHKVKKKGIRSSIIFEKMDNNWMVSQWHNSVPEIGLEDKVGWASEDDIRSELSELIEKLGMDPNIKDKEAEIKEYLIKAKALLDN